MQQTEVSEKCTHAVHCAAMAAEMESTGLVSVHCFDSFSMLILRVIFVCVFLLSFPFSRCAGARWLRKSVA